MTSPPADTLLPDPHDVVSVTGPEAASFLHGQLSQDVVGLAVGAWAWSFVLAPDGKLDAVVRLHRTGDDAYDVVTEAGFGEPVATRLTRFRLRTDCEIVLDEGRAADGVDEAERIEAGVPRLGIDVEPGDLAATTGLVAEAVDFTKGCYVGQELVARMESRGGTAPTRLVRFRGAGDPPDAGAAVTSGGDDVGTVSSVAPTPEGFVALGRVSRKLDADTALVGECDVVVESIG